MAIGHDLVYFAAGREPSETIGVVVQHAMGNTFDNATWHLRSRRAIQIDRWSPIQAPLKRGESTSNGLDIEGLSYHRRELRPTFLLARLF
jgi:hypothetical protein